MAFASDAESKGMLVRMNWKGYEYDSEAKASRSLDTAY